MYGEASDKSFIYIHGQGGNKEEGERFSFIAQKFGYQTLAVDLPEHCGRTDEAKFEPWFVTEELSYVIEYAEGNWKHISVMQGRIRFARCAKILLFYTRKKTN